MACGDGGGLCVVCGDGQRGEDSAGVVDVRVAVYGADECAVGDVGGVCGELLCDYAGGGGFVCEVFGADGAAQAEDAAGGCDAGCGGGVSEDGGSLGRKRRRRTTDDGRQTTDDGQQHLSVPEIR